MIIKINLSVSTTNTRKILVPFTRLHVEQERP